MLDIDPEASGAAHGPAHDEAARRPHRRLLRRISAGVTTDAWAWIGGLAGQQLFYPPNVAGWDDSRWLDTATFRGRWIAVGEIARRPPRSIRGRRRRAIDAPTTLKRALAFWNNPELTPATHRQLLRFTQRALHDARSDKWKQVQYPVLAENALRHLIAVSPDLQTA